MDVCRHFARGNCAFGSACRQAHIGSAKPAQQEEQRLELEEERIDGYDDEPCTFRQLREKYFGQYSEYDMRQYWQNEMRPTGNSRPALRVVSKDDGGNRVICRYFMQGSCTYGESCRNLHVLDVAQLDGDAPPSPPQRAVPCGATTGTLLELDAESIALPQLPQRSPAGAPPRQPIGPGTSASGYQQHDGLPQPGVPRPRMTLGAEQDECGICFDSISNKGEKYGMLENCDHAFCLSCIRSWRKQKEQQDRANLRRCPVCRNESFFVVPCENPIIDVDQKAAAVVKYKKQMSAVPCKAFDYGRGKCALGTSCFYAHLNPDGTRFKPLPVRKMEGASGRMVHGDVKLSDFTDRYFERGASQGCFV